MREKLTIKIMANNKMAVESFIKDLENNYAVITTSKIMESEKDGFFIFVQAYSFSSLKSEEVTV